MFNNAHTAFECALRCLAHIKSGCPCNVASVPPHLDVPGYKVRVVLVSLGTCFTQETNPPSVQDQSCNESRLHVEGRVCLAVLDAKDCRLGMSV